MMSLALMLLSLTLLLPAQLEAQLVFPGPNQHHVITHFGICITADYGPGKCVYRNKCDFFDINVLDAASRHHCYSQQRPQLVCCPQDQGNLPLVAPRVQNNISSISTTEQLSGTAKGVVDFSTAPNTADELPKHPHCGTSFAFKVYGGSNTGLLEFPWTTLLEYTILSHAQKQHNCGASFIAQRWLLTAAHCLHEEYLGKSRKLTGALLGEWNRTSNPDCITYWNGKTECAPLHIHISFDRQIIHPLFDLENLTNDIALLRLAEPVDWRQLDHVEPVCLPPARGSRADQLSGSAVDVSGWGLTEKNNQPSAIKRKAVLYVQPHEQCQESLKQQNFTFTSGQICASGGIGVDSCSGDSGGPLTVEAYTPQRDRFVYLAGIVSYGKELCGKTEFPGVYTRVSSYMDWIEETIRKNSDVSVNTR